MSLLYFQKPWAPVVLLPGCGWSGTSLYGTVSAVGSTVRIPQSARTSRWVWAPHWRLWPEIPHGSQASSAWPGVRHWLELSLLLSVRGDGRALLGVSDSGACVFGACPSSPGLGVEPQPSAPGPLPGTPHPGPRASQVRVSLHLWHRRFPLLLVNSLCIFFRGDRFLPDVSGCF